MSRTFLSLFLIAALFCTLGAAEETSFRHIKVPDAKGKQIDAVLTFSDHRQAINVQPAKGDNVSIPYSVVDKFSYEFSKHHRINEATIITAPIGVGAVAMLTKSRSHWLEIDYQNENVMKAYVIRMDKKNYIHILDAIKAHTGKDTEILGNANKR
ncbi:MAG TPA: hypothetical protein VMP68_26695 [Candidatus Eisenbacteria bacterium]|nr:hypothetical protein [Candidatus Eisenbacteria bacterium]